MDYSKLGWTAVMAAFAVSMAAAPVAAKGGSGNAKVKQPTVRAASAKPAKAASAKAQTPKVKAAGATTAKSSGPRPKSSKPTMAKSDSKPTLAAPKGDGSKPTLSATDPSDPTLVDPNLPGGRLNKAQQLLMKNDNLRMKMQTRLAGMDPIVAASGFRNLGQFVAAVNASYNNPGVSFRSLKALMVGEPPMSLGQALQQLRGVDSTTAATAANKAMAQADSEILAASSTKRARTKGKS